MADDDLDVQVSGQASDQDEVDFHAKSKTELKSGKNKSRFYMEDDDSAVVKPDVTVVVKTDYAFPREEKLADLSRVYCLNSLGYLSTVDAQTKPNSGGKLPEPIDQEGRLELTNYCLRFLASNQVSDCFNAARGQQMFEVVGGQAIGFVIPLMHIAEVRGVGASSDKLKKLSAPSEVMVNVPKELYIKCKNFSTKYFLLTSAEKSISQFAQHLLANSNSYQLRSNRFQSLLERVNFGNREPAASGKSKMAELKKSYLRSRDLRQELEECQCAGFMSVRSAPLKIQVFNYQEFIINPNMSSYAVPRDLDKVLQTSRVVINEQNVQEFAQPQLDYRQSMYPVGGLSSGKKPNRLSEFLTSSSSSKSATLSSKQSVQINSASSAGQAPSTPVKATKSSTNPFMDNRFPVWSFTNVYTGCSLIVTPEALPNRQDQCDIILKNYNAFLCDELVKIKLKAAGGGVKAEKLLNVKRVDGEDYGEYEFFKFKVPFNYEKIQLHYYRLMQMCSYRTSLELYKESETTSFYSTLHGTKWLKNVSVVLALAAKIVAGLHVHQRNVFVEEDRANSDVSCVLASLARLLLDAKCRSVAGFENLIHKEWFLAGHKFYDRLLTTLPLDEETESAATTNEETSASKDTKKSIAPVFLLFLDAVFQLTVQYPSEFEFNELYLIHLWDYALSGASYTFSFNGQLDWLANLSKLATTSAEAGFDENLLGALFEANNELWHRHLEKNWTLFANANYQPQSELILNPCDKIYVLKFWSRCYLRWYDIKHPYSSSPVGHQASSERVRTPAIPVPDGIPTFEEDEDEDDRFEDCSDRKLSSSSNGSDNPPAYKPPPPPPTPPTDQPVSPLTAALPILRINITPGTTRIGSNGDMQTNL